MITTAKAQDVAKGEAEVRGASVLVDRLWPRGVSKAALGLDFWLKGVAPSPELRKWWNHDPDRFDEFRARYERELAQNDSEELQQLLELTKNDVTLLFAAHDKEVNHAVVLADWLARHSQARSEE